MWKITARNISQKFNRRTVFENISFELESGHSLVLAGPNGSGKTTLIRVICQLVRPTTGRINFSRKDREIAPAQVYSHVGLVGPYLQLYNNLTALENFRFFARIRRQTLDIDRFKIMMDRMGLRGREFDELRTYSSGMLQRMKYIIALMHQPEILILDEPTANLDQNGAALVYEIMESQRKDKILLLATNEPEELKFGEERITLGA